MRSFRRLIGIGLLTIVMSMPAVLAGPQELPGIASDGTQESPGTIGEQESSGVLWDNTTDTTTTGLIFSLILKVIP